MQQHNYDQLAGIFKALAHPTRARIIAGLIKKEECNVMKIVENLAIPQPNVSQHLNVLKNHGIIEGFRRGNQICYKVINERVKRIFAAIS